MTLTDKAILVVLMVGNTSCYGGECMMMHSQSLQSIAIFPPKKTIFPQHSYRDIMDRQQDDDGDAADADAPSTDKLNGRNARIIQLIKMETIFISINSSSISSASR